MGSRRRVAPDNRTLGACDCAPSAIEHRHAIYNAELNFCAVYNKVPVEADSDGDLLPVDRGLNHAMDSVDLPPRLNPVVSRLGRRVK
jgi:hypothetical protein